MERESWMTELPERYRKNFGVGARTFKSKTGNPVDEDQSGWTETPADRQRKALERAQKKPQPRATGARTSAAEEQLLRQRQVDQAVDAHNVRACGLGKTCACPLLRV